MPQKNFTAPSPEAMNALLPAFEFKDLVASNSLGAVYFAIQRSLGRQVAIKVFSPDLGDDVAFRKSFQNASKVIAARRNTNLIGLFDSGLAGGMLYHVMEFVPGKSLARSTRGQVIELGQAMAIFDGICDGLDHAHGRGLVHGNLDTLSILLNQQAVPKIGGFGLSRPVHTDAAAIVTTHTTAPEVLSNFGPATVRSDVYSLGAIFYELITGKPLESKSAPTSNPKIDAVLKQATATDPSKRIVDVRAFQNALKEAALGTRPKISDEVAKTLSEDEVGRARRKVVKVGFDYKLLVRIAIIIALLFGINMAWKAKNKAHADRARVNREIVEKDKRAKEAAKALAAELSTNNIVKPTVQPAPERSETVVPAIVPEVESPAQSLARLKSALAAGSRREMPIGTVDKGDSSYFLVSEPMTWAEAAWFAEQHGGHLATPDTDLTWLADEVTKGEVSWLGAARSGAESWTLVDGAAWTPPAGSAAYLTIGFSGGLTRADDMPLPSVIQWHGDGSNPGTLAATLAATRVSLAGDSPVYPPGTIVSGSLHYLFVPRRVAWQQARALAENGGGHLMVPSDAGEIAALGEMTERIPADNGIWLGGFFAGGVWQWATGEPWTEAKWIEGAEVAEEGAVMALRPGLGWDAVARDGAASGFLIEWSADSTTAKPVETVPAVSAVAAGLDAKVKELVFTADKKRGDALAGNVRQFRWSLDAFLRNLVKSSQPAWAPHVNALKECVKNDRIQPGEIGPKGISVSPDMAELVIYHVKKQEGIATQFGVDMAKIRDTFVVKLTGIRDEAKAAGQTKLAAEIAATIEQAEDLDAWIRSFGIIPRGADSAEE